MDFQEEIREFVIESSENLAALDDAFVRLERSPDDINLISNAFRTIHTIKGTCGFFEFNILGAVAHITENILSQVRDRERPLTPDLTTLLLESVDTIKLLLQRVEATGSEGEDNTQALQARLRIAFASCDHSEEHVPLPLLEAIEPPVGHTASEPPVMHTGSEQQNIPLETPTISEEAETIKDDALLSAPEITAESRIAESTIRVDVNLLDRLMNLVGELVLARNQLLQETSQLQSGLLQTSQRINLITSELQESVMKTRMQPIGIVWNKLPRVVRDLAAKCGKSIRIEMQGAETELDKTIIESIKDPLTHIVRNSCDHGIEAPQDRIARGKTAEGKLLLRAYHEGGVVNIEVSDDGAGIDPARIKQKAVEKHLIRQDEAQTMSDSQAVNLIFLPGFSTAAQVTSISGRGVGMDVVKTNIEKIGGSVEVLPREEGGTTLRIKIPLTLAIIPGLVVMLRSESEDAGDASITCDERFIIPQANLLELVRIEGAEIEKRVANVHGTPVFHHRGKLLPLTFLRSLLANESALYRNQTDALNVVVLQAENRQLGLVVDQVCDTQEIVVKPLGRQLKQLSCYVGATIMGDGQPALILDAGGLYRLAGLGASRQITHVAALATSVEKQHMMLLFSTGSYSRMAVSLSAVDRIEDVAVGRILFAGGRPILHYRGGILSLANLAGDMSFATDTAAETVTVIVFRNGTRCVGLVVDKILDIVTGTITARRHSDVPGQLGSALLAGEVVDLLDLHAIVRAAGENWLSGADPAKQERPTLLLVDRAATSRDLLSEYLEASGYDVLQSETSSEAGHHLRIGLPDALLLSSRLPGNTKREVEHLLLSDDKLQTLPVIELLDGPHSDGLTSSGFAKVSRNEREMLLQLLSSSLSGLSAITEVVQ